MVAATKTTTWRYCLVLLHRVRCNKTKQYLQVVVFVAATIYNICRASNIVRVYKYGCLIKKISKCGAVTHITIYPIADEIKITPHALESVLHRVKPLFNPRLFASPGEFHRRRN